MTDPNPLKQAAEEAKARKLAEVAAENARDAQRRREEAEWNMVLGPGFQLLNPPTPMGVERGTDAIQHATRCGLAIELDIPPAIHPARPTEIRVGVARVRGTTGLDELETQLAQRGLRGLDAEELIEFWNARPEFRYDESIDKSNIIYGLDSYQRRSDTGKEVLVIDGTTIAMQPLFPTSMLPVFRTIIPFTYIDPTP